ncbi:unnamed protein product [Phytophthora lilii]|uniref:Unnamed protein product n=1 Tax=Phytophthora lilii TaxID=2077276 RepID=A0A9W6XVF7_9STRA|nr:unnamed protein product [Phytophthora lilii]
MSMKTPQGSKKGVLTNVWHIPKLSRNLFSVGRFTKDVGPVTFETDGCFAEVKGLKWKLGVLRVAGFWYCVPVTGQPKPVQSEPTLITPPRITPLLIMPPVGTRL